MASQREKLVWGLVGGAMAALLTFACSSPYAPGDGDDEGVDPGDISGTPSGQPGKDAGPAACELNPQSKCGAAGQCGCAAGETCDVQDPTTGMATCVKANGQGALGANCTDTTDCKTGLACLYAECRPYCENANTACNVAGTQICVSIKNAQGAPIPKANMCTIACDPTKPGDRCGSNNCVWFADYYAPYKVSDCTIPGTGGVNAVCQGNSDCAQGFACNGGRCQHWCHVGMTSDCEAGQTCADVYGSSAPAVQGVREGLCQ